jgi:hypothetical protein
MVLALEKSSIWGGTCFQRGVVSAGRHSVDDGCICGGGIVVEADMREFAELFIPIGELEPIALG